MEHSSSLTAKQVKAARALLAWSQSDLARAARVAVSTIADFERGQRTPVANNAQAIREALQAEGIGFMAGGVVSSHHLPPPAHEPAVGQPLRWVTATDLAQWGERRDGQAGLPELVSRLIYAAYGRAARLRFPSDESITYPGWDGVCEVEVGTTWIPGGTSVWEIGAQRAKVASKAEEDYVKRSKDPLGLDQMQTTFVFITPQRWSGKDEWAAEKRAEGIWRDVRVLDADELVHWLEAYPGVATWLALRIGRRPEGLREIGELWNEWALATKPPLNTDLIVTDRDEQAVAVLRWLRGQPAVISVQAEAADEAMAFLYAALQPLPDPDRLFFESRCLVASSDEIARRLLGLGPKLIIVLTGGDPGLAESLVAKGHHVYAAYGSDIGSPTDVLRLARPWRYNLERSLEDLRLKEEEAHKLATTCGRSLTILRRLMAAGPGRQPAWASSPPPPALLVAMLAGAWRQDFAADRKIIEKLSGQPYDAIEAQLVQFSVALDGPMRRSGAVWKLASLRDAWFRLARYLTAVQVDRFAACFQEVLGTPDPDFDAEPSARWLLSRKSGEHPSQELRRGLAETMIALGVYPNQVVNVPDAGSRASHAVRALLSGADERVWWSLSGDFRRLAEAAPDTFLTCIDEALASEQQPLRALFRSDEGFVTPMEYLSDLLWALEMLAWSPIELAPVSLILARLAEVDPGGRTLNRPASSLRRIFLPWSPQTYAGAAGRLRVLDRIIRNHPDVGWKTLLSLAPKSHDTSSPSPLPVWRDFTTDECEVNTWADVAKANHEIGARLLEHVGADVARWTNLLEYWANFEAGWRKQATAKLDSVASGFIGPVRDNFREELRKLLHHHEAFPDAEWSMKASDLAPLREIFEALEPEVATERHAWLFDSSSAYRQLGLNWQEGQEQLKAAQIVAANEILAENALNDVLGFARSVKLTHALGSALAASDAPEALKTALLEAALEDADPKIGDLALGLLFQLNQDQGESWLNERFDQAVRDGRSEQILLRLALALPSHPSTWLKIEAAGSALERSYWRNLNLWRFEKDQDLVLACEKLMASGRSRGALQIAGQYIEAAPPAELLIRILKAAVARDDESDVVNDGTMFSYYLGLIFKRLDQDESVGEDEIAGLEWIYFQALEHSERPPRTLHKALATHPEFFVQMLSAVYRPAPDSGVEESPGDAEAVEKIATQAWHVLHDWSWIPGSNEAGEIDGLALETWVKEARQLCAKVGRAQIGDSKIGEILSAARRQPNEAWPPEPVRDIIEICRSRELEEGFTVGLFNRRGVTMRSSYDGGAQERALADTYRADARAVALEWPRTRAVLERIAQSYDRDAEREDRSVEQRDW